MVAMPSSWRIDEALARYPELALVPSRSRVGATLAGVLRIDHQGPDSTSVQASYAIEMQVPLAFPKALPRVVETERTIPRDFHRNPDNSLCLGSPLALHLAIREGPTVSGFIERAVVPYLYGHAVFSRFGEMPFGELDHGYAGLAHDARRIFRLPGRTSPEEFFRLAGMKRRVANKRSCPCHSGLRLGRCHARSVNDARRRLGRGACRAQHSLLLEQRRVTQA